LGGGAAQFAQHRRAHEKQRPLPGDITEGDQMKKQHGNAVVPLAMTLAALLLLFVGVDAQRKHGDKGDSSQPVLWQRVNIGKQDLFLGPGGRNMEPDLSRIILIKEEKGGHSKKFRIKDGSGRTWVAKIGDEAQSETASVRFLYALGYVTEINYLVPSLTIPGKGTFSNVRLEARPDDVKRGEEWKWGRTPFERTPQMQGLMLMMAFLNNWDMKSANNVILKRGNERQYVISDLGVSFGKTGSNPLPLFWRIGRSRNDPKDYAHAEFVKKIDFENDRVRVEFNGKNRSRMKHFTIADARWLASLLEKLSDSQIRDAFRAANYSSRDVDLLTHAVKDRIGQLARASGGARLADLK
jgi:hypothetical protein